MMALGLSAQSTSQDFPSPIVSNEISGTIKARDLGDSRLTTYYYALNGDQGDLFINLVTKNFTGDIDVFTVTGQRPMTKIVVYADYAESETGRAIYLRKAEKLLLRIQGRTPNDDDATFRLKFAGSFVAARPGDVPEAPELPRVSAENRGGIRVSTAGTILPPPPKPEVPVGERTAEQNVTAKAEPVEQAATPESDRSSALEEPARKAELIVSDPVKAETTKSEPPRNTRASRRRAAASKAESKEPAEKATAEDSPEAENAATKRSVRSEAPLVPTLSRRRRPSPPKAQVEPKPDPLESINLVVQFKDGNTLEKKMSEVSRFSVDKGVLVVVLKNGTTSRYPILDVARVTIE